MVLNLIISYSQWFFIITVPAFHPSETCMLYLKDSLVEDSNEIVIEYLRVLHILEKQESCFFQ